MTWRELYDRYARLIWALHSAWALISGIVVLVLAHNRYGYVRWVILFIALTWASTLFFSRASSTESSQTLRFAHGVASYLTRVMYQETLFFLIPFYFYSATFPSWNFLYVIALAAFAVLSCFDVVFDKLLRERRGFAIAFFAFVSFSALQFFLPLFLHIRIDQAETIAALIAFIAAVSLTPWNRRHLIFVGAGLVALALFRPLLPPVPLRLTRLRTGGAFNASTFAISGAPGKRLYVVATVFSPQRVPARMQIRFYRDGTLVRAGRVSNVIAQADGFRVWDSIRDVSPGEYQIEVWTSGQLLGRTRLHVTPATSQRRAIPGHERL